MNSSFDTLITSIWQAVLYFLPLFLCIVFIVMWYQIWVEYKRREFLSKQKMMLLEIRLPKEITKSPLATELFLNTLHITGGDANNWYDKITVGKSRPFFSYEIVSIGGQVKFFIYARANLKKFIESQVYAQYPGIEVVEVSDYTQDVFFNPKENNLWGCNFELNKADVYPIKSYVDYNLDKDPKEEMKIDPITPILEFLGSLQKGEQVWIQIIAKAHKKEPGQEKDPWKEAAKEEIAKIKANATPKGKDDMPGFPNPTKGENETIGLIEKNLAKSGFDCGIRALYIADRDVFDPSNISGLTGVFKQYNSDMLNGFKPAKTTTFDFPWQDFTGKKIIKKKQKKLDLYKWRAYFGYEEGGEDLKSFVLNTESLATIYHYPGNVAQTPTFNRVLSKKGEPPANLPI